jgi:hypothetical protein
MSLNLLWLPISYLKIEKEFEVKEILNRSEPTTKIGG